MSNYYIKILFTFFLITTLIGCTGVEFGRLLEDLPTSQVHEKRFIYKPIKKVFFQPEYGENRVSFSFKVYDEKGQTINKVSPKDIILRENDVSVNNFQLRSDTKHINRFVDIVFILDVTGSMREEIDAIKNQINQFVIQLAEKKLTASLCLVSFGDNVRKKCSSFHEDDPDTIENENLKQFKRDLTKERIVWGGDEAENSLGGIIAAVEETPWHRNAQRLAVLVTDATFHDGGRYPSYEKALSAIEDSKTTLFIVAPDLPGYSGEYNGMPPLTSKNFGTFFDFSKVENEGFEKVFSQILSNLSTEFVIDYSVDENSLDPTLDLKNRKIDFAVKNFERDRLEVFPSRATLPEGRPVYKKEWTVFDENSRVSMISVFLNDQEIRRGFEVSDKKIIFDESPAPGSKIAVTYEDGDLIDHIDYEDYSFYWFYKHTNLGLDVYLNLSLVKEKDTYTYSHINKQVQLSINSDVFSDEDPFKIRENGFLDLRIETRGEYIDDKSRENNEDEDEDEDSL